MKNKMLEAMRKPNSAFVKANQTGSEEAQHQDWVGRQNDPVIQFNIAMAGKLDSWVPASGGTETEFLKNGVRYLYCYNPAQHKHAYINLDTDMEVPEDDWNFAAH